MTRDRIVKALLVLFLLSAPCLAQTSTDLRLKYGEPETLSHKSSKILVERYRLRRAVMLTVKYADGGRACELRLEQFHSLTQNAKRVEVMEAGDAAALVAELAPVPERGRLIKSTNVEFGCSSVVYQEYERVMIATTTRCARQGGGTYSVKIRWKDTACEQIDQKDGAPKAAAYSLSN